MSLFRLHIVFIVACVYVKCYSGSIISFGDYFKDTSIFTDSIGYIKEDLAWLQSSLTFNPNFDWSITPCDFEQSPNGANIFKDALIQEELFTDRTAQIVVRQLEEIWKSTRLLDNIPFDLQVVNYTTWCLFAANFILTLVYCVSTISGTEDELTAYLQQSYKPRKQSLYTKINETVKRKKNQSTIITPPRKQKFKKKKLIPSYLIEKQIKQYLLDNESQKRDSDNLFKLKSPASALFNKKQSKSDLEKRKRLRSHRSPTSLGNVYNLDNPEDIPWDILDILLCIRSPCYEHDHDHICVVGNQVYTIPNWTKTTTPGPLLYESSSPSIPSFDGESLDEDRYELQSNNRSQTLFQPINPARIVDVTDVIDQPTTRNNPNPGKPVIFYDIFGDEVSCEMENITTKNNKQNLNKINEKHLAEELTNSKINNIVFEATQSDPINPTLGTQTVDGAKSSKEPLTHIPYQFISSRCIDTEDGVWQSEPSSVNVVKAQEPFVNVNDVSKVLIDEIYPSPQEDTENSILLYEDDIGLPCANSSFKSDINRAIPTENSFMEGDIPPWAEDSYNLTQDLTGSISNSYQEIDFNISTYLHNVSSRLVRESTDLHDLNKTLSFYGDVSTLELGASYVVRGLLNQIVQDLNLSSRAESLVNNISSSIHSFLNNTA